MAQTRFIAVSGLMGAGKTTLARGLASVLGYSYLPNARPETLLLKDLFADPSRWAFETQTAFLVTKALQLYDALHHQSSGVVLDRTLYEDADVFAEYFHRKGHIDTRSYGTYRALATHFIRQLPSPHLVIYCDCSLETARSRLVTRPGGVSTLYPPGHLDEIAELYAQWRECYDKSDMVTVDTQTLDFRVKKNIERLSKDIQAFSDRRAGSPQLQLFREPMTDQTPTNPIVRALKLLPNNPKALPRTPVTKPEVRVTPFPSAYIAAPFTLYATESSHNTGEPPQLFDSGAPHGILGPGTYREFLLNIERALRRLGIRSVIPHRDVNAWGERILTPSQVMTLCSRYVVETDLFVGILGTSHGAHYEFGIAQGLGKPSIIVRTASIPESFIAAGASTSLENVYTLTLPADTRIDEAFLAAPVRQFLERFLPIRGE